MNSGNLWKEYKKSIYHTNSTFSLAQSDALSDAEIEKYFLEDGFTLVGSQSGRVKVLGRKVYTKPADILWKPRYGGSRTIDAWNIAIDNSAIFIVRKKKSPDTAKTVEAAEGWVSLFTPRQIHNDGIVRFYQHGARPMSELVSISSTVDNSLRDIQYDFNKVVIRRCEELLMRYCDVGIEGRFEGTGLVIGTPTEIFKYCSRGFEERVPRIKVFDEACNHRYFNMDGFHIVDINTGEIVSIGEMINVDKGMHYDRGDSFRNFGGARHNAAESITTNVKNVSLIASQSSFKCIAFGKSLCNEIEEYLDEDRIFEHTQLF